MSTSQAREAIDRFLLFRSWPSTVVEERLRRGDELEAELRHLIDDGHRRGAEMLAVHGVRCRCGHPVHCGFRCALCGCNMSDERKT